MSTQIDFFVLIFKLCMKYLQIEVALNTNHFVQKALIVDSMAILIIYLYL